MLSLINQLKFAIWFEQYLFDVFCLLAELYFFSNLIIMFEKKLMAYRKLTKLYSLSFSGESILLQLRSPRLCDTSRELMRKRASKSSPDNVDALLFLFCYCF